MDYIRKDKKRNELKGKKKKKEKKNQAIRRKLTIYTKAKKAKEVLRKATSCIIRQK